MTPAGFALTVIGASLGCLIRSLNDQNRKEREAIKRRSFAMFVDTGMKDKNFYLLSWRAERLAEKLRKGKIWQRTNSDFTAWAQCPSCGVDDFHSISAIHNRNECYRQCNKCFFKWRQK